MRLSHREVDRVFRLHGYSLVTPGISIYKKGPVRVALGDAVMAVEIVRYRAFRGTILPNMRTRVAEVERERMDLGNLLEVLAYVADKVANDSR
jgi:hypothetical protein